MTTSPKSQFTSDVRGMITSGGYPSIDDDCPLLGLFMPHGQIHWWQRSPYKVTREEFSYVDDERLIVQVSLVHYDDYVSYYDLLGTLKYLWGKQAG